MTRSLHTGWYISADEYMITDQHEDMTIYLYKASNDTWSIVGSDEVLTVEELPVAPQDMLILEPTRIR